MPWPAQSVSSVRNNEAIHKCRRILTLGTIDQADVNECFRIHPGRELRDVTGLHHIRLIHPRRGIGVVGDA